MRSNSGAVCSECRENVSVSELKLGNGNIIDVYSHKNEYIRSATGEINVDWSSVCDGWYPVSSTTSERIGSSEDPRHGIAVYVRKWPPYESASP